MKNKKLSRVLSLKKQTVVNLADESLKSVKGGVIEKGGAYAGPKTADKFCTMRVC